MNKNTGFILAPKGEKDWVVGGESKLVFDARMIDGDWSKVKIKNERQYTALYDNMSCATYSVLNPIEKQVMWLISEDMVPEWIKKELADMGFFDDEGFFDASDWFTAVMSGTKPTGNTLQAVWESVRTQGLLPQRHGYNPEDFKNVNEWLDPKNITQEQKDKALRFIELFDIAYEWVVYSDPKPEMISAHLRQAPIQIATSTCNGWNSDEIVKPCGLTVVSHATCAQASAPMKYTNILDQYEPFEKKLAWDYPIPFAIKGVVSVKSDAEKDEPKKTMKNVLEKVNRTIVVNAGHYDDPTTPQIESSGAVYNGIVEQKQCALIRDELVPILERRGYTVHAVPDALDLSKSIAYANDKAPKHDDALVIDIHLNALPSSPAARGTEAFYLSSPESQSIAATLSAKISESMGIPNRGAKKDTEAAVGSLGWIRQTKAWASLVEVCFMTNEGDMAILMGDGGHKKAALGIANGIDQLFGTSQSEPVDDSDTPDHEQERPSLDNFDTRELAAELLRRVS